MIGSANTINQKSRFIVEIDGFDTEIGFSKAGPVGMEITNVEYNGGGRMTPHKEGGRGKFKPVTCEIGSTTDAGLYDWMLEVLDAIADAGLNTGYKRNITITQLDREGLPVVYWHLYDAFMTDIVLGDWDGSADEFLVETMELEYDAFEREAA